MHALFLNRKLKIAGLFSLVLLAVSTAFYSYADRFQNISFPQSNYSVLDPSSPSDETEVATSTTIAPSPPPHPHSSTDANKGDQIQSRPPSAAIVAAVKTDTDLGWLNGVNDSMWKLHRYNFDDPDPPPKAWFPANKGKEAMMYLSYIITNYDSLPDYSIFTHGHQKAWHQEGDMVDLINNLRIPAVDRDGYVPLRCDWYPSCPAEIRPLDHDVTVWGPGVHREDAEREIGRAWTELFGSIELPRTIASQCCAQFVVTRHAIRRRSKADYEKMREWLYRSELIDDISGRVFEKLWAYIMTGDAVRCPPPQQCACEYFGQCSPRDWPIPPEGLAQFEYNSSFVPAQ